MQEVKPEGSKTLCYECPYWEQIRDTPDYGMCKHPTEPWFTSERIARDEDWAFLTDSEQSCLLPAKGEP